MSKIVNYIKSIKDNNIFSNENFYKILNKSEIFYSKAILEILTTQPPLKINNTPRFSVVIPIFSTEKTIKRAIISAQNQNFSNFEIILIDDFSKDKTLNIIEDISNLVKIFN